MGKGPVKRGRPKAENPLVYTSFRLTKDEKYEIYRRAKAINMKPSKYIRHILNLLPEETLEELSRAAKDIHEIHRAVTHFGNNFNQALREFHMGKETEPVNALRILKSTIMVMEREAISMSQILHKEDR